MAESQFLAILGDLMKLVILSILLERGLAFVFEHDWFRALTTKPSAGDAKVRESRIPGLRGTLALAASFLLCRLYGFDVLDTLFANDAAAAAEASLLGMTITAFVAAGGSAGAIAVFQGALSFNREAREAMIAEKKSEAVAGAEAAKSQAEAKIADAAASKAAAEAELASAQAAKAQAEARKAQAEVESARAQQEGAQLRVAA